MTVTADTITDEQIRALKDALADDPLWGVSYQVGIDYRTCVDALEYETMCWTRDDRARRLRARCAEMLNQIQADESGDDDTERDDDPDDDRSPDSFDPPDHGGF